MAKQISANSAPANQFHYLTANVSLSWTCHWLCCIVQISDWHEVRWKLQLTHYMAGRAVFKAVFRGLLVISVFIQFPGARQYKISNPFDVIEHDSYSSQILTSMASFINDECTSSPTESSTSESQKISLIPVFF